MYIKYITLQGFKSYKDAIKTDELSPHHNIVVGRNGSGKSNFFAAIQFVLSEEFTRLSPEQRQSLIYEGAGASRIMTAYVEIIFDNSDNRLLVSDKSEVALRRVIGSKKDQFFLDGKLVTRNDVMNLLESAGFSRSNPYYIVRQGKINEIATAKESQRLKLLKEVAGTRVYDERKQESQQLMVDTEAKIKNSDELLTLIDDKLRTLETEKAELLEYQKLDKKKRALEYSITTTELAEIKKNLDQLAKKRSKEVGESAKYRQDRHEAETQIRKIESELSEHNRILSQLIDEESSCQKERTKIVRKKQKLDLQVTDLQNQQVYDEGNRDSIREELEKITEKIEEEQNNLEELSPKFESVKKEETELSNQINKKEITRDEINARRGRKALFQNKEERDDYLQKQIESITNEIFQKNEEINYCKEQITQTENVVEEIKNKIDKNAFEKQQFQRSWEAEHNELTVLKRGREMQFSQTHEIIRKENTAYNNIEAHKQNTLNKKTRLNQFLGRSTYNAIKSLNIVKDTFRRKGRHDLVKNYFGMAIDFISCAEDFYKCVEAAAGGKLFNFVMKDVATVKAYIDELNKQNLPGTPQMLPLNSLKDVDYKYPEVYDENKDIAAFPLIERMDVSRSDFIVVAKHIFGRYMVTVDSNWSNKIARDYNLSCVTLDGDITSSQGVMSGGYRDNTKSRLRLYQEIHRIDENILNDLISEHSNLKSEKLKLEEESAKLLEDITNKEALVKRHRAKIDQCLKQEVLIKSDLKNKESNLSQNISAITHFEDSLLMLNSQRDSLVNEKNSEFSCASQLSQFEQDQLVTLTNDISEMKQKLSKIQTNRRKLERQKNAIHDHLTNNLNKRRDQLINETDDISVAERQQNLAASMADLETSTRELEYVETRLRDLTTELNLAREEDQKLKSKLEECQNKEKECTHKLDEDQKKLVKITTKQQSSSQKQDELERKLNEIGPVAQDIVAKYRGSSSKNLYSKLHQANTSLQKYTHVNKKALDQYLTSSDERRILSTRHDEILKGKKSIQDMMDVLEEKKYNQIMFTFQQVSKYFKDVFSKLVPGGHADLIMQTKPIEEQTAEDTQFDTFTGVSIKVSFAGNSETREMTQLSGGQKSLVALTLIFAIQKCDPAPFYLSLGLFLARFRPRS